MKLKGYGPIIMIIVVLAVLAGAQEMLSRTPQPEMLQSQVGGPGNSLKEVTMFELEIALRNDQEIELLYIARDQDTPAATVRRDDRNKHSSGEEAMEEIQIVVESSPAFTSSEPLTLIQGILDQLQINQADVREFELEFELMDGTERKIELEVDADLYNNGTSNDRGDR